MSERKVLNKYYPPDYDPSKIPRVKKKTKQNDVRIMAPFNLKCNTCGNYIANATKFNAKKETVEDETYNNLMIFRFYIKCPRCMATIIFRTNLKEQGYEVEHGATENFTAERHHHDQQQYFFYDKQVCKKGSNKMAKLNHYHHHHHHHHHHHFSSSSSKTSYVNRQQVLIDNKHLVKTVNDLPIFVTIENYRVASYSMGGEPHLCLPQLLQYLKLKFTLKRLVEKFEESMVNFTSATPKQVEGFVKSSVLPSGANSCPLIKRSDADKICLDLYEQCYKGKKNDIVSMCSNQSFDQKKGNLFGCEAQNSILSLAKAVTSTLMIRVYHRCFGKCNGIYYPSLLTNSNSKSIECASCKIMLTPRRFIGHTHGSKENNVCHWGFNSYNWRHYIRLSRAQKMNNLADEELLIQFYTLQSVADCSDNDLKFQDGDEGDDYEFDQPDLDLSTKIPC